MYLVAEKISSNFCLRAFPSLRGQLDSSWWQKMTWLSTALETPRAEIISRSISAHFELRLTFSPCLWKQNSHSSSVITLSESGQLLIWGLSREHQPWGRNTSEMGHKSMCVRVHTRTHTHFSTANPPTGKFLESGRKPENLEESHRTTRKTPNSHLMSH